MEFEGEIGGQNKPSRHLFLVASRRHRLGQCFNVSYSSPNWEWCLQDYTTYWNPTAAMITGEAPEGQCVGGVEADTRADPGPVTGGLRQVLSTELAPDTAYTLTVKVGNPNFMDYPAKTNKWPGYRVQLLAAETVLAEDANTVAVPRNTWITSSVNYTSGPTVTPGQSLEIRLVNMALVTGGSGTDLYVLYDDVHLTATSASTPPTIISYGPLSGSSFPLVFSGRNGQSYEVLSSTNVALPMSLWTTQSSGLFGVGGPTLTNYTDTSATNRAQFYRIRSP